MTGKRCSSAQQKAYLFDQLVGTTKQSDWKLTAERLGSLQIDDQLERRRLHDLVGPLADVHGFQCRSGSHYLRSAICRTHCSEIPSAFPIALSVAPDFRARAITLLRLTPTRDLLPHFGDRRALRQWPKNNNLHIK